jgi:hypothetical protein
MKNQYFGDINDYKKYSILRALSGRRDLSLAICWMLTGADGRTDGQRIHYLQKPEEWRSHAPQVFDFLRNRIARGRRAVRSLEASGLLASSTVYFGRLLDDNPCQRKRYFSEFASRTRPNSLVFFDPDNGLEVNSVGYGRRDSSKYLFWEEVISTYRSGHSVLIYQHFPRVSRSHFRVRVLSAIANRTEAPEVTLFITPSTMFILLPQHQHMSYLRQRSRSIEKVWKQRIVVTREEMIQEKPAEVIKSD